MIEAEIMLREAARLYTMGMGVHWIKPNSKAPVDSGWADGTRQDMKYLTGSYREGYGLGVRLGAASKFPDGTFLANLDVDIKSPIAKHRHEALAFVQKKFPGLWNKCPAVTTGYGLRYFFRTVQPLPSKRLAGSPDIIVVFMPSAPISKDQEKARDTGLITQSQLDKGFRVRSAWEVEFMSAGKQVVLPPSIHPDTKKPYQWDNSITAWAEMPLYEGDLSELAKGAKAVEPSKPQVRTKFVTIDYMDQRFSAETTRLIFGEGVGDRSAACFSVAIAMVRAGFTDDEIISTLTDQDTFLGQTAFDHRKTTNRDAAAAWARDYCLLKARKEGDARAVFEGLVVVSDEPLGAQAAEAQMAELVTDRDWREKLKRVGKNGEGGIKPTLGNVLLILMNDVSPGLFRRDAFANRDFYGTDAPWTGAKRGKTLTDDDAIKMKEWLELKYHVEVGVGTIYEAMTAIAVDNAFHPVRDELRALPPWDGVPRVDTWLARHFEAKGPATYLAQVFRKWLVASITRAFEPGAKFDWLPIFEGLQGVGKSSFGEILFGLKYHSGWLPNLADKDAAMGLHGKRVVEFSELASMRRNEIEIIKAFITRQVDNLRPPYGRRMAEYPRGVVFYGTTNLEQYLQDDTGNRRFNPVKVGMLDFDALRRDRDQLWAEALLIYDLGLEPSLYLQDEAAVDAVKIQQSKMVQDDSDLMAELICTWAEGESKKPIGERADISRFPLNSLFHSMGPLAGYKLEIKHVKLATKALKRLGALNWKSDGNKVWGFRDPKGQVFVPGSL